MSEIKVFEKLSDNIQNFTKEEFIKYYKYNKEEIDKMKTRGINIRFKIDGYKIIKRNGQMIFKKDIEEDEENDTEDLMEIKLDALSKKISKLEKDITLILKLLQSDPSYQQ